MSKKIYVGNLSYNMTEESLSEAFSAFGTVDSVKIIKDRDTNRSKGFGFVEMASASEAQSAIKGLNGAELEQRKLTVNEARPMESRDDRGSFGRSNSGGRSNRW